jgi:hypothetical protein
MGVEISIKWGPLATRIAPRVGRVSPSKPRVEIEGTHQRSYANLLTMCCLDIVTLCAMDEGGCLRVEAMQAIGMLVHEGVVLRHKLPTNLGRVGWSRSSRSCRGHYLRCWRDAERKGGGGDG